MMHPGGKRVYVMLFLNGPLKGKKIEGDGNPPDHYVVGPGKINQGIKTNGTVTPDGKFLAKPDAKKQNKKGTVYKLVWFEVHGKKTAEDEPIGNYTKVARYKATKPPKKAKDDWTAPPPMSAGIFKQHFLEDFVTSDGAVPAQLPDAIKEAAAAEASLVAKKLHDQLIETTFVTWQKALKGGVA